MNSVTQSDFLCYLGAQHSHDKNKLHDKNTAQAKRQGMARESVHQKEPYKLCMFQHETKPLPI